MIEFIELVMCFGVEGASGSAGTRQGKCLYEICVAPKRYCRDHDVQWTVTQQPSKTTTITTNKNNTNKKKEEQQ